jgi:hypothetical protein
MSDGVVGDAIEPGGEARIIFDGVEALVDFDEDVLEDVLGVLGGSGASSDVEIETLPKHCPEISGGYCHSWLHRLADRSRLRS